ncbi:MAG: CapA family protein, partial [Anaerolineae bacterium]|nr:CapA family protein [Anaerolineae bacterium]
MLFFLFLLTSCWKPAPSNQATATPTSMEPVPTSLPPVSTPQPVSIWIDPAFPYASGADLTLPDGYEISKTAEEAAIKLSAKADEPFTEQVFALVAPFFTLTDGISAQQLMNLWQKGQAIPDGPDSLLVDDSAALGFEYLWGKPSSRVYPTNPNDMLSKAQRSKRTWVLIPFDQLDPAWKVIAIDGDNPLWKEFNPSRYPLRLEFGWIGAEQTLEPLRKANPFPTTNRFPDHLTTVMVTGTTALVRGTGALMELHGMTYPAGDIGPWLQNADILHISNEIAFAKNCPPQSNWDGLAFCSQPRYIELLEEIGTDVVDLTGDHFADWSEQAMRDTLQMYATRGWLVFGGGENLEAGRQPALFEHNGNKIAFL